MMELPTLPIRMTSTCPTVPSCLLTSRRSAGSTGSASRPSGSASGGNGRCWSAASSSPTNGAAPAVRRASRDAPPRAGWPTSRSAGVRRRCWCGCADTGAPGAATGHCQGRRGAGRRSPRAGLRWALEGIVCQHRTVGRVAAETGRVLAHREHRGPGRWSPVLISDPSRFEGVKVIGVDEHAWRRTRRGDK